MSNCLCVNLYLYVDMLYLYIRISSSSIYGHLWAKGFHTATILMHSLRSPTPQGDLGDGNLVLQLAQLAHHPKVRHLASLADMMRSETSRRVGLVVAPWLVLGVGKRPPQCSTAKGAAVEAT